MTGKRPPAQRAARSLKLMPGSRGEAACDRNTDFDILAETDRVPRAVANDLSRICAGCGITDCGFRQTYRPVR